MLEEEISVMAVQKDVELKFRVYSLRVSAELLNLHL